MPRSYSYDHFTAGRSSVDSNRHDTPHPELQDGRGLQLAVHYGGQHTETEHLYHAHEMARLLDALIKHEKPRRKKAKAKSSKKKTGAKRTRRTLH
jgi:hypothetical protein